MTARLDDSICPIRPPAAARRKPSPPFLLSQLGRSARVSTATVRWEPV